MSYGPSLLQKLWKEADEQFTAYKALRDPSAEATAALQGRIRGVCYCISIFMVPHFTNEDDVLREVVRRAKARAEGDDLYESPGLNSRRYEAPPSDGKVSGPPLKISLDTETIALIEASDFPAEALARMFKTSVLVVNTIRGVK